MREKKNHISRLLVVTLLMILVSCMPVLAATTKKVTVGTSITYKGYTKVTTSDKKVASVTKSGSNYVVKALKAGTATIKCYQKSTCKKTISLVVSPNPKYDTSNLTLAVGESKKVAPTGVTGCTVAYKTSNSKVATVNSKGTIKGVKAGNAVITVTVTYQKKVLKTFTKKVAVKSNKKLTGISVTTKLTSVKEGYKFKTSDFTVKYVYSDGSKEACGAYSISWKLQSGYYVITVKDSTKGYTQTVKVKVVVPTLKSIKAVYTGSTVSDISQIKAANFKVTGTYDDGSTKAVTSFSISMNGTVTNGKYTVTVKSGNVSTTVQVPTTNKGTGTSTGTGTSKNATGIKATTTLTSVKEGYSFKALCLCRRNDRKVRCVFPQL